MESHLRVVVTRDTDRGLLAQIGDTTVPIVDYAVQYDGKPVISLAIAPDAISIDDRPSANAGLVPETPKISSWGGGAGPDPREKIPGWEPEPEKLSGQVADHALRVALRTWEPSDGQPKVNAFKRLIRLGDSVRAATA